MFSTQNFMHQFLQENTLRPASYVSHWKKTLVVAPHPQDEALGCGGAITLLRQYGFDVKILYITHGHVNHMADQVIPKALIREIKEKETAGALHSMGLTGQDAAYLRIQDQLVPAKGEPGFEEVSRLCLNELEAFSPDTVVIPCRYHHYDDHYASWQVMQQALDQLPYAANRVEYMIWKDDPKTQEMMSDSVLKPWRLDIQPVMQQKIEALVAFRSQKKEILDWFGREEPHDPIGGVAQTWETFLTD